MTSWVEIANGAISRLGGQLITSLTDNTKPAQLANARYKVCRDAVLRMHPWNCATARARLAPSSTAPAFGFVKSFPLPSDCLRVIEVQPEGATYRTEGRALLSDYDLLDIRYVKAIEDAAEIDSLLGEAISCYMAHDLAFSLQQSAEYRQVLWQEFEAIIRRAKSVDGMEDAAQRIEATEFTYARNSGPLG